MTRPLVPLLLFATLLLVALPAAGAAQEQPPKKLWDEFPLEPTATPAVATPQATPTARVIRVSEPDEGISPGALLALLVGAAGFGGIAARMAARRLPHATSDAAEGAPATNGKAAPATRGDIPSPPAPVNLPTPIPRRPEPLSRPAAQPSGTPQPPATPQPSAPAKPPSSPLPVAKREEEAETKPPPPTLVPQPEPETSRRFQRKPKPAARPVPAAKAAPRAEPAGPARSRTPKRDASGRFVPAAKTQPRPAAPSRPSAASPRPASCTIKLGRRPPLGRFVAVAAGGRVLARSPVFRLKRSEHDNGPSPPEALGALVEELTAAGWRKTAVGRTPWDLRFEREPQDAVTRRASPPRA
jgi:hypothetical protein